MTRSAMYSETSKQRCHQLIRGVILLSLALLIFLNPFQSYVSALTEIFFYTALVFALPLLWPPATRPDVSSPLGLPFFFFLLWALASTLWAFDWKNTLHDVYGHLLKLILLYYLLIAFVTRKEHFLALIWTFIISTTLFSLGAIIYTYIISGHPLSFRLYLKDVQTNQIAQCCLFGTALALFYFPMARKWREKTTLLICCISNLAAVILTYSRAALLALALGSLFVLFASKFKKHFIIATLVISFASILIFNLSPDQRNRLSLDYISKDGRIIIYATTYEMIKDKPLAGYGYGGEAYRKNFFKFNKELPQKLVTQIEYPHPHNVLLDITTKLGVVGLVLFCWILFRVFKMGGELMLKGRDSFGRQWGTCVTASLVTFLTVGSFGNILNRRNAVILYSIMAMITILWKLQRSEGESFPEQREIKTKGSP